MENTSPKNVVEKIKKDHIQPENYWKISWKSYLFWAVWIMLLILGALFFSLMMLNFVDIGPEFFHYFGLGKFLRLMVMTAPYLWIMLSLVVLFLGIFIIRKTKRGYRYDILFITSVSVLAVSIIGIFAHLSSFNRGINESIYRGFPKQRNFVTPIEGRWHMVEEGLLAGEITEVQPEDFLVVSFRNKIWKVLYSEETVIIPKNIIKEGMRVGIIGEKIDEGLFKAKFIRKAEPIPFGKREMTIK